MRQVDLAFVVEGKIAELAVDEGDAVAAGQLLARLDADPYNDTVAVAEARVTAARARLAQRDEVLRSGGGAASGNAFVLRAPIAGRVAEVFAALGASYTEGAPLFRIVRGDRVELQAQVPPNDADVARSLTAVALEIPGRKEPVELKPDHVHDAGVIDKVRLEAFDKQLGAMFGFAKGVLLCIAITFFAVTLLPPIQGQQIVDSHLGHYIVAVLNKANAVVPPYSTFS